MGGNSRTALNPSGGEYKTYGLRTPEKYGLNIFTKTRSDLASKAFNTH